MKQSAAAKPRMPMRWYLSRIRSYVGRPRLIYQSKIVLLDENDECKNPIFLIGVHRSGTSLLRRIFNAHPNIACPPETFFLKHYVAMADDEMTKPGFEGFGLEPDEAIAEISRQARRLHEGFRLASRKPRWADKTPQYIEILDGLKLLFGPGVRFVMIYRHPLDSLFSIYRRGWLLASDAGDDAFENALAHVRSSLDRQTAFEAGNPDLCVRIKYEDLVAEPEPELRRVFAFLQEPWDEQVLRFYDVESNYGVEDPVVRGFRGFVPSHGNWTSLSAPQVEAAVKVLAPHLARLGYAVDPEAVRAA